METIRKEFCQKYKIPRTQKWQLDDARTMFICAFNHGDWTYVDKLVDLFPDQLMPELYDISWHIFTGTIAAFTPMLRVILSQFSKTSNLNYKDRGLKLLLDLYLYKDNPTNRFLNRFYQSCKEAVNVLLQEKHDSFNIYVQLLHGRDLKSQITRVFTMCADNANMRQSFSRFVIMCIIFDRCNVIENMYQSMKKVAICPPIHAIAFVRHSACVIQRRWRSYMNLKAKRAIARVCYKLDLRDNIAYVIYNHSCLQNSYKKI